MDRDPDPLLALLLDPFLTASEAEREAAAIPRRCLENTAIPASTDRPRPQPALGF